MPNDLDPRLLRWFATTHEPLGDAHFSEQLIERLPTERRGLLAPGSAGAILGSILSGIGTGVRAPLRVRHAWMAIAAAALTLWALVLSP